MAEFAASRHGVVIRSWPPPLDSRPRHPACQRTGWLTEPARGVLVVSGYPPTWEQRLAIVIAAGTRHPGSATALQLRACSRWTDSRQRTANSSSCDRNASRRRLPGNHRAPDERCSMSRDRYERRRIAVHGLARTLVDLGSTESEEMVWRALIAARRIHRVNPLWLQQTAVRLHRPGQQGTGVMMRRFAAGAPKEHCPTRGSRSCCAAWSYTPTFLRWSRSTSSPTSAASSWPDSISASRRRSSESKATAGEFHFGPTRRGSRRGSRSPCHSMWVGADLPRLVCPAPPRGRRGTDRSDLPERVSTDEVRRFSAHCPHRTYALRARAVAGQAEWIRAASGTADHWSMSWAVRMSAPREVSSCRLADGLVEHWWDDRWGGDRGRLAACTPRRRRRRNLRPSSNDTSSAWWPGVWPGVDTRLQTGLQVERVVVVPRVGSDLGEVAGQDAAGLRRRVRAHSSSRARTIAWRRGNAALRPA